ncbi:UNVERIFIED_CONTAM: hypothetical protein Slati_2873800 [Sesamum latifolium]|uniref:Alpha/beta-Hydrolases superfamily protein n=1 Tax=Sesamum latifolium TaxID=2727402 RepID=A0AAW2VFF4_9LAMI
MFISLPEGCNEQMGHCCLPELEAMCHPSIEDLVLRDVSRWLEESEINSCGQHLTSPTCNDNKFSSVEDASSSRCCNSGTTFGFHEQGASDVEDQSFLFSRLEIVNRNYYRGVRFIFKGVVSRVVRTLHGSSDDIGWLQYAPEMAPVEDGSARFLELLQEIRNGLHKLPDSFVYLLIPGLFSNHGPLYFVSTKRFFSKMGLACHIAKIHSEASVEHNAWELKQYIEELYWGSGKRVMLLGHSKGGVDAAAALSIYSQELRDKVAGLALVQSPYGGTPIASDILREGQVADKETRRIMEFLICKLIKGDIRALEDLTYEKRKEFIRNHKLPDNIPLISFHSEASVAPGVIATMSHIAHAELPWLPPFFSEEAEDAVLAARKVPVIFPVSAAMALSALHLQLRYGEKSDGLVTCRDAEVPGSVVVKPDKKLDHSWMVYSSWKKDPTEPDACEMCEALLTMLVELGEKRSKLA